MGFKCGIVGLPNVGKSTLFNALTQSGIDAENYPFCTIDPNIGIVAVPDSRLEQLAKIVKPQKILPATMEFVDIAGLVAGASRGEGLGNKFLANIREADAIAHVVRCFADDNIVHVAGKIDPSADIEVINTELALADLESVEKALAKSAKVARVGDQDAIKRIAVLEKIKAHLDKVKPVRTLELTDDEKELYKDLPLITEKPVLYIANVAEDGFSDSAALEAVREIAANEGAGVITVCATIESELAEMTPEERVEFLQDLGLQEPGLNRIIRVGYKLLGLHTYFTAGEKEVRAWTIPLGASAPQAAGKIHTDFERGFIRAEVVKFTDFIKLGGEHAAKEAGKLRSEGKEYIVDDGDVIHFRFNV